MLCLLSEGQHPRTAHLHAWQTVSKCARPLRADKFGRASFRNTELDEIIEVACPPGYLRYRLPLVLTE